MWKIETHLYTDSVHDIHCTESQTLSLAEPNLSNVSLLTTHVTCWLTLCRLFSASHSPVSRYYHLRTRSAVTLWDTAHTMYYGAVPRRVNYMRALRYQPAWPCTQGEKMFCSFVCDLFNWGTDLPCCHVSIGPFLCMPPFKGCKFYPVLPYLVTNWDVCI